MSVDFKGLPKCLVAGLFTALILGFWLRPRAAVHAQNATAWEYRVVNFQAYKTENHLQNVMNHYGNGGWEYLGPSPVKNGGLFRRKRAGGLKPITLTLGRRKGKVFMGLLSVEGPNGLLVKRVEPNSCLTESGLEIGAIIIDIDGLKANEKSLRKTLSSLNPKGKRSFTMTVEQSSGRTKFQFTLPQ